jgi:hypothetical protein
MAAPPSFSPNIPNKIGDGIEVSGKNTLIMHGRFTWRAAIAVEPIDARVNGKKMFCVRVDNAGEYSAAMIGLTPRETFDSTKNAWFGGNGFSGVGLHLNSGHLYYPVERNSRNRAADFGASLFSAT